MVTQEDILNALKQVKYPNFDKDIVTFEFVKEIEIQEDNKAAIRIEIPSANPEHAEELRNAIIRQLRPAGLAAVSIDIRQPDSPEAPQNEQAPPRIKNLAPQVKNFVMVSSGKGGVGKSTTSVNLAVSLAMQGHKVGLLDADVYGPNIPRMLGITEQPQIQEKKVIPPKAFGVEVMSMGLLFEEGQSLIWRGPMIMRAIQQMLTDILWSDLDVLIIDMPPGTGDAQLTLAQSVPVAAGINVTTPQKVALDDSRRSLDMFKKLNIPIAGIIENMSGFISPDTGIKYDIFGMGTSKAVADEFKTDILTEIPIEPAVREGGDEGRPIVYFNPESTSAKAYLTAADSLWKFLEKVMAENAADNSEIQPQDGPSACSS